MRNLRIAIIGGNDLSASWAAIYVSRGNCIQIFNSDATPTKFYLKKIIAKVNEMSTGFDLRLVESNIFFCDSLASAVISADIVHEASYGALSTVKGNLAITENNIHKDAILLVSNNNFTHNQLTANLKKPENVALVRPCNPIHIMPLVELFFLEEMSESQKSSIVRLFHFFKKNPVTVHKELSCSIADRLQAIILKEASSLIDQGVVNLQEMDEILRNSLGVRWVGMGSVINCLLHGDPHLKNANSTALDELNAILHQVGLSEISKNTLANIEQQYDTLYTEPERFKLEQSKTEMHLAVVKLQQAQQLDLNTRF